MNLEFPNDNHHSYIIKDGSKRCKAGVAGLKLLITKERETGIEPATSSLGSWHSTTELLPLAFKSAIYLIPDHLHETAKVSKVSEIHQIYPVWSKNGHQNDPGNVGLQTVRFSVDLGVHSAGKRVQPHYTTGPG